MSFPDEQSDDPITIIEATLFEIIVKKHAGECLLRDLRPDAVRLLPPNVDLLAYLENSSCLKVFKTRSLKDVDQYLIIVHEPGLKMCMNYNKGGDDTCSLALCPYIHICKRFLAGLCKRHNCRFSHELADSHKERLLRKKRLADKFTSQEMLYILKCSTLQVCPRWNRNGRCGSCDNVNDIQGSQCLFGLVHLVNHL